MNCALSRTLLDKLIQKHPDMKADIIHKDRDGNETTTTVSKYIDQFIGKDANIVHNKTFKNAIVKLQLGLQDTLNTEEKQAVSQLSEVDRNNGVDFDDDDDDDGRRRRSKPFHQKHC